ncbi:hypothetical protein CC79DRAFT_1372792 [Sarocladium strictum]
MPLQSLPVEIKSMIWGYALPNDVSEVCIRWPSYLEGGQRLQEPYLVDIAFPVLMHICLETRQFLLSPPASYSHLVPRFRFSKNAGCKVPYRFFRPELDVIYLSNWQYDNIKTLSIVFPGSESRLVNFDRDTFQSPGRRCQLKKIEKPETIKGTAMMPPTKTTLLTTACSRGRLFPGLASIKDWIELRWEAAAERADIAWAHAYGEEIYHGSAWDRDSQSFAGITCTAYTFEQFKRGEKGQETWEEVCSERMHHTGYEPARVEMTRDPTEWRVNDEEPWPPGS